MRRLVYAAAVGLLFSACDSGPASSRAGTALVQEQLAYHVGVVAYLYGYPMVDMYRRMHNETHRVSPDQALYAPANTLSQVAGASWAGWLDLREGPVILAIRGEPGMTVVARLTGFDGQTFPRRLQLPDSGAVELEVYSDRRGNGTGWHTPSPFAHLAVQSTVPLPAAAIALRSQQAVEPDVRIVPLDPMRSLGYFEVLNLLLREIPAAPGDQGLLRQFTSIGVGPSDAFSQASLSPAAKRGLERAIRDARAMLEAVDPDYEGSDVLARAAAYRQAIAGSRLIPENSPGVDSR